MKIIHIFISILSLGLLFFSVGMLTVATITPITFSGFSYLLGLGIIGLGGFVSPWRSGFAKKAIAIGTVLFSLTLLARILFVNNTDQLQITTLPEGNRTRLMNRVIAEQDVSIFGAQLLPHAGLIFSGEMKGLLPAFEDTYQDIENTIGIFPSPFAATYSGMQSSDAFDAIIVEPSLPTNSALIFLHGAGGNFTVECWLVAEAALDIGLLTICPSTGAAGNWWAADGEQILRETINYARARGASTIILAGLSNGGNGIGQLAPKFSEDVRGLVFISGFSPTANTTGLPTLVIHGVDDVRFPVNAVRNAANRLPNATYAEFPDGHFVLIKRPDEIQQLLSAWLQQFIP
jgi:pimeloyl-ACP methyl ester carboxylesterase